MHENELKPCPFCGGGVDVWDTEYGVICVIECANCKTRFVFPWTRKGTELFKFWNRRTSE